MQAPRENFKNIPSLPANDISRLFSSDSHLSARSYEYRPESVSSDLNYNARLLFTLYQSGVNLINSGLAYQTELPADHITRIKEYTPLADLEAKHQVQREILLSYYYRLLPENKGNLYQTLFILQVALDHLNTASLLNIAKVLELRSSQPWSSELTFPNGSHLTEKAAAGVIGVYIASHKKRFEQEPVLPYLLSNASTLKSPSLQQIERVMKLDMHEVIEQLSDRSLITREHLDSIKAPILEYINATKLPFFGHSHTDRARKLVAKLINSSTVSELRWVLNTEQAFFEPKIQPDETQENSAFQQQANAYADKEQSGYYRAIVKALDILEQPPSPDVSVSHSINNPS